MSENLVSYRNPTLQVTNESFPNKRQVDFLWILKIWFLNYINSQCVALKLNEEDKREFGQLWNLQV